MNEILLQYNLLHLENQLQLYLYGHVSINSWQQKDYYLNSEIHKGHSHLGVSGRVGVGACYFFIIYGFVFRSICLYVSFVFNYFIFIKVFCCKFLGLP